MHRSSLESLREQVRDFKYTDFLRHLQTVTAAAAGAKPLRVAILRSYTLEPMEPVLRVRLALDGHQPEIWIGGYNQYAREILDSSSELYRLRPQVVLLMTRLEELIPSFVDDFPGRTTAEWSTEIARACDQLADLARRAARDLPAQVIVQNMSLGRGAYYGIHDAQSRSGQSALAQEFNRGLSAATSSPGVFVWDFEAFARAEGMRHLFDPKGWYVSRSVFKQSAYPAIVADIMRYVRSAMGRMKKCVALDLDNTLWGGVVGEDGFDGIELGDSYPGNCFKDFQRELLKLHHRGILLVINSKNNEADALRVIDDHPDMVLRRKHFAAMRINWTDKATNLRELAAELNIGLDSFLFLDDNPVECALVRRECPECEVIQVPDRPYLMAQVVADLPEVDNIRLTDEDKRKGEMYRAQAARRELEQSSATPDLKEFLRELQMKVAIEPATSFSIPRIAQLTQKTNQMNTTTRRYTEAQVQSFVTDPECGVYSVSASDRFGDHGIIGVLILQHEGVDCRIDAFLLSCRVIGRGIEETVLEFAAAQARERGRHRLVGEFIPTAKNAPAADVFPKAGFTKIDDTRYVIATET